MGFMPPGAVSLSVSVHSLSGHLRNRCVTHSLGGHAEKVALSHSPLCHWNGLAACSHHWPPGAVQGHGLCGPLSQGQAV